MNIVIFYDKPSAKYELRVSFKSKMVKAGAHRKYILYVV